MNTSIIRGLCFLLLLILFAEPVCAASSAHGDYHAPSIGSLLWPCVNFMLYLSVLYYAFKKMGSPALKQQAAEVKESYEQGLVALADAERGLESVQQSLKEIEQEKAEIVRQLDAEGKLLAGELIEKAGADISKQELGLERRVEGERRRIEAQLRADVVREATAKARGYLEQNLDAQRDVALRRDALLQLKA